MSTDPHVDRPEDKGDDNRRHDTEQGDGDDKETETNPAFQCISDEIGRRFRKALDKLA